MPPLRDLQGGGHFQATTTTDNTRRSEPAQPDLSQQHPGICHYKLTRLKQNQTTSSHQGVGAVPTTTWQNHTREN